MKKKLGYKTKNKLLLLTIIVSTFIIYSLTIKKTIALISKVNNTEQRIMLAKDAPAQSNLLKKEIDKIDHTIGNNNKRNKSDQQSLLELVTDYCRSHNSVLREFPEVSRELNGEFVIETNRFIVEGSFSSLLSLVYILEQKNIHGKIASVDYSLKKDLKTREMALTATIYLQNIKKNEN